MDATESQNETNWPKHVPRFVRRVLLLGCGTGEAGGQLKHDLDIDVFGVEPDPDSRAVAQTHLDGVAAEDGLEAPLPFPAGYFDGAVICRPSAYAHQLTRLLPALAPVLDANGIVFVLREGLGEPDEAAVQAHVAEAGWGVYCSTSHFLFAVRPEYNPILHARALLEAHLPEMSFEVLAYVPSTYHEKPEICALLTTEMLMSLLAWDATADGSERMDRFTTAQVLFYRAASRAPEVPDPYQCMAEFWRRIGNPDMAARLLRSIACVAPTESVCHQLEAIGPVSPSQPETPCPPSWEPPSRLPRVLFITHERPDYELDVVYDGLCTVLGEANVVEYPWKPTLHGEAPADQKHYPCMLNRPGRPYSLEEVCREHAEGRFDYVLYGDVELHLPEEEARQIGACAQGPFFVLDGADDARDYLPKILERVGKDSASAYFKREMLTCAHYPPGTYPLPFAYLDDRIPDDVSGERPEALFWAGHRRFGLRSLYLPRVERLLKTKLDAVYTQEKYVQALLRSRIGLNIFGAGFDTVRYWELPAHGCLLLSERLPIHIPHNFRDGESAVFFDDLPDLEQKLTHYLAHPDEAQAIAMAGHEHLKRHHTASARARHLLGWIQHILGEH